MATDTVLNELILQEVTHAEFEQLGKDNLLDENRIYLTPDNSLKGNLFDFKWADHLLNDISWLRADTFSWQSGDVYVAAYNHLVADFENAEVNHWYAWAEIGGGIWYTKTPTVAVGDTVYNDDFSVFGQVGTVYSGTNFTIGANDFNRSASNDITVGDTETIAGIEITYYRAEDGHKICLPDQEDKILALYNATGVAWYYILDTENKQFKLPRTKFGFTGLRDEVGGYVPAGLPNITGSFSGGEFARPDFEISTSGAIYSNSVSSGYRPTGEKGKNASLEFDASRSSSIYGNSDTVQEPATQMYLYFYVGNFERDAVEQMAGVTTEMFNNKADVDLSNMNASQSAKDTIVGWSVPDYSAGVDWVFTNANTAPTDGFVVVEGAAYNNQQLIITINGIEFRLQTSNNNSYSCRGATWIPVAKGDTVQGTASYQVYFIRFYPCKGVL